jgi:hypothetical protein
MTPARKRALTVVCDHQPITAAEFGRHVWPNHPPRKAKGYASAILRKMADAGLAWRLRRGPVLEYGLTTFGERMLHGEPEPAGRSPRRA